MAKKKKTKFKKDLKKTLRKSNKGSNKLIYAVGGGLAIVLIIFVIVVTGGDTKPVDKEQAMLDSIDYVAKVTGIVEVKALPEEDKIIIVYNTNAVEDIRNKPDYKQIARFAGIRVWNELHPEDVNVLLTEVDKKEKDYFVVIKDGSVVSEQLLDPPQEEAVKDGEQEEGKPTEKSDEAGKDEEAEGK
ncbi:MAG: hypothetical protein KAW12_30995 [Candidatus Aminicenantes bacterium]|nr:hypothetical protein [Candidatus Aminicenantes bacterium]